MKPGGPQLCHPSAPPKSWPFCWVCPGARENKLADPSAYGEYDTFWLRIWWICWDCFTLTLKFTDVSLHNFVGDSNWSLWQAFRPGHRAFEHATVAGSCKVTDSAGATFVDVHCTGLAPSRRAKWVYTIVYHCIVYQISIYHDISLYIIISLIYLYTPPNGNFNKFWSTTNR